MSKFRSVIFWLFIVLAVCFGVFGYFELKNNKRPKVDAFSLLPDSCLVYLNTRDLFEFNKKLNSQSLIADRLKLFGEIDLFCTLLSRVDSLIASNEGLKKEFKSSLLHFALYGQSQWLLTLNVKELGNQENVAKQLALLVDASKTESPVYTFSLSKNKPLYFQVDAGVLLVSNSTSTLKRALTSTVAKFENSLSYNNFRSNLNESNFLGLYVDQALYATSTAREKLDLSVVSTGGILAGAIELEPSELKVNGYLLPDSTTFYSALLQQGAQSTDEVLYALPPNTQHFECFGFSSYAQLASSSARHKREMRPSFWSVVNTSASYNVQKEFEENAGTFVLNFETSGNSGYTCLNIKDTVVAAENMQALSDTVMLDDSIKLYRLRSGKDFENVNLFESFLKFNTQFAFLWGPHIYFSETEMALHSLLSLIKRKSRLIENENFSQYKNQHIAESFNYLTYTSPAQNKKAGGQFFKFKKLVEEDPYENFKHLSYSLSGEDEKFKFRFHLQYQAENEQKNTLWTLSLDTAMSLPPAAFINHLTKENEVVVQDLNHVLYLVNAKGNKLWKKQLREVILSPIYVVDIFKNNKYQMLFSSRNFLHLIDRNGNYVEGYPVKLPSEATSALSVFDYEHNKDYRIFISCKNKLIYNYSIYGIKQEGFVNFRTDNEVVLPIQYAAVAQSQYLVAVDKEGKIYTFSRKGVGRIGLRNRTTVNCSSFYVDASNSIGSTYLVYFDEKEGLINKISFDDRKEIIKVSSESDSAHIAFGYVDENRSMDMLITKGLSVKAYDFAGSLIAENESEFPLARSNVYRDANRSLIYSLSTKNANLEMVDLADQTRKSLKAGTMPLISNLFRDNKMYLIFGNGKFLNCVLMN